MGARFRLAVLVTAAAASGASIGGPGPPKPDKCSGGEAGEVQSLEIGAHVEDSFVPLEDGAAVELVIGDQGGEMFAVRYRLSGPSVPGCVAQESELRYCPGSTPECDTPQVMASSDVKLKTYEEPDGSRATRAHFLILSGSEPLVGAPMQLSVTAAGLTETRTFYRGRLPADGGAPDAL